MDIEKLESRRANLEGSTEYQNFTNLINDVRDLFCPTGGNLRSQIAKGTKSNRRRVSDIGIEARRDYVAGVVSEMITPNEQWFDYDANKKEREEAELLADMSKEVMSKMNASNFIDRFTAAVDNNATDGSVCVFVERIKGALQFTVAPFGTFWFTEDYNCNPNTVWVEKVTTARALVNQFGKEVVSEKCRNLAESKPEEEVKVIFYCAPDPEGEKPFTHIIYEKDAAHQLEEKGLPFQKYIVYRGDRIRNELWGRGPCIETVCGMAAVERSEKSLERANTKNSTPWFAIPATMGQGGYKLIHDADASFLIYNNMTGHAPQEITSQADMKTAFDVMRFKAEAIRRAFYLDYFNPLQDRKNMTLGEAQERVAKSHQMVGKITEPLEKQLLTKLLKWVFHLEADAGTFGEFNAILKRFGGRLTVKYTSRMANAQRRIRLSALLEALQHIGLVAQYMLPQQQLELLTQIAVKKLPEEIFKGTNAPLDLLLTTRESEKIIKQVMDAQAQQAQVDNSVKLADAAAKGSTRPDAGSPTAMMMGAQI